MAPSSPPSAPAMPGPMTQCHLTGGCGRAGQQVHTRTPPHGHPAASGGRSLPRLAGSKSRTKREPRCFQETSAAPGGWGGAGTRGTGNCPQVHQHQPQSSSTANSPWSPHLSWTCWGAGGTRGGLSPSLGKGGGAVETSPRGLAGMSLSWGGWGLSGLGAPQGGQTRPCSARSGPFLPPSCLLLPPSPSRPKGL